MSIRPAVTKPVYVLAHYVFGGKVARPSMFVDGTKDK